ncbi:RNA-dependent RNA polymerase [Picobirnavirus sp.]|uniref:RNA-dependent RNA polymerase n=1 Tax=Picobirnavirus sp. TaxID=1907787 RepID=UPI000C021046|nr:RNA-dependent RNA polymerase [Picobirnavirus sp.]ATL73071.1 RNA-dependent RNA polymerase [Picobirnavirus sp.]
MPKNNESKSVIGKYFSSTATKGLQSYFGRVVKGQPDIYDTPFAKGESTEELLSRWSAVLESIDKRWPSLWEFENDMKAKVGPLSVMKPLRDRMSDVDHYYDDILLSSEPIRQSAINAVLAEWGSAKGLRLRSTERTLNAMKKSTNSGSPYFTKRRRVVEDTVPYTLRWMDRDVYQALNHWDGNACAILGWRGQEGGSKEDDVKQRVVWMFPFAVNISELRCYQPLIEVAQKNNIVSAWVSNDAVDRRITTLFDTKGKSDLIVCTDFTKFDQHFNPDMQDAAKSILSRIFAANSDYANWLEQVFPIKYMIPLMYNYGLIRYGKHGMGSGSGGTNADETLSHRALQFEAAQRAGKLLNPNSQCLGDDGILTYPGITVEDVIGTYQSHGLEMNASKQYVSTNDCTYLRRWHCAQYRVNGVCVGVYSTFRALGRLRYLERYMDPEIWNPKTVALRQLSILENVKYHPLRDQFVEFCMKRDKYRLGIDIPHFLDDLPQIIKEVNDYMPDFLGYTKTLQSEGDPTYGIADWWIVKYLRSRQNVKKSVA